MFTTENILHLTLICSFVFRHSPSFTPIMLLHTRILILKDMRKLLNMNKNRRGIIFGTEFKCKYFTVKRETIL